MIKNMKNAIIDMPKGVELEFSKQKPAIEVIIKKGKKVIYHNKTYAVVMNMVQSMTTIAEVDGDVELEGDSQVFGAGNYIIQMFAMNELERKLGKMVLPRAMGELQHMIKDPKIFKRNAEFLKQMIEGK